MSRNVTNTDKKYVKLNPTITIKKIHSKMLIETAERIPPKKPI